MQSLFPQGNAQPAQAPLVQFRAGKCTMSSVQPNGKFLVTPDLRSGRVSLSKGNDGLLHFKWTNAVTNTVEDDRIVFPGEYTFKKVKTGRNEPTDRVFMLRYNNGQQRLMYWMQEKEADKDDEVVKKVNDFLLNPNAVVVGNPAAGAGQQPGGVVSPDEWMRMIGLDPSAAGGAARSSSAPLGPPLAPEGGLGNLDLSQILRTLAQQGAAGNNVPPPAPVAAPAASTSTATPGTTAGTESAPQSGATGQQGEGSANGDQSGNNNSSTEDEDESGGNMEQ